MATVLVDRNSTLVALEPGFILLPTDASGRVVLTDPEAAMRALVQSARDDLDRLLSSPWPHGLDGHQPSDARKGELVSHLFGVIGLLDRYPDVFGHLASPTRQGSPSPTKGSGGDSR